MQGRAAKLNPKEASESDIEIDLAARENFLHAPDSLPAMLGHVPQLGDKPEESADDDGDGDEDMQPDGDEELLSPIPDLFAMQGIKTPSKGQHEHAPLFATIRSAAT
jgi:hypothetical protein